jgi:hypothetical protein
MGTALEINKKVKKYRKEKGQKERKGKSSKKVVVKKV